MFGINVSELTDEEVIRAIKENAAYYQRVVDESGPCGTLIKAEHPLRLALVAMRLVEAHAEALRDFADVLREKEDELDALRLKYLAARNGVEEDDA